LSGNILGDTSLKITSFVFWQHSSVADCRFNCAQSLLNIYGFLPLLSLAQQLPESLCAIICLDFINFYFYVCFKYRFSWLRICIDFDWVTVHFARDRWLSRTLGHYWNCSRLHWLNASGIMNVHVTAAPN